MTDKERIKELEDKLAAYTNNPASEFYLALTTAIKHITKEINNKRLNLDEDPFSNSILKLAEKADKIFLGLEKGLSIFAEQKEVPKKQGKSNTTAF